MIAQVFWNGRPVPFCEGETLGSALTRAGISDLGRAPTGQARAVFCGIGQCQGCLVRVGTRLTEACLLPCVDGLQAEPDAGGQTDA
ncbi:MAG: 2Fe-2S iron-sulfur cluster-binding protein [Gemmobacter sp.]|nr:2Fe-2S iron-sulfur cluster-binding protein [Gemmobacter sp.]